MKYKNLSVMRWLLLTLLLLLTFGVVQGKRPFPSVETATNNALPYEPAHYGVVYLYPHADWGPDKRAEMDAVLAEYKAKGVTTIVQTFSASYLGGPETARWLIFLDAAAAAEIDVIAYLWPRTTYPVVGGSFQYDDLKAFLDVVGDHEALIGYIGLHEPLEPAAAIDADELRGFYTEMKSYAPHLLIAHYMGDIAYAEAHRTDGWTFSDGMCDICLLWFYPFTVVDHTPVYEQDGVTAVVESNIPLLATRDPDAQFWFLGQTFVSTLTPREMRMPTAAEMETLYLDVMAYPVDGFLWYPCNHTEVYDQVLCDPEMTDLQNAVDDIGNTYVSLSKLYLPVVIYEHNN